METTIKITKDESLKLLGLFKLATDYYAKLREAEFALNRALGKEGNYQGNLSDALYGDQRSADDFYKALKLENVVINEDENG